MREAKERVEYERKKENIRRKKRNLRACLQETFNAQVQDMCKKLFEEIEDCKITL